MVVKNSVYTFITIFGEVSIYIIYIVIGCCIGSVFKIAQFRIGVYNGICNFSKFI